MAVTVVHLVLHDCAHCLEQLKTLRRLQADLWRKPAVLNLVSFQHGTWVQSVQDVLHCRRKVTVSCRLIVPMVPQVSIALCVLDQPHAVVAGFRLLDTVLLVLALLQCFVVLQPACDLLWVANCR